MRTLILSCPTLEGEMNNFLQKYHSSAEVRYLPARLHSDMQDIRPILQKIIDEIWLSLAFFTSTCSAPSLEHSDMMILHFPHPETHEKQKHIAVFNFSCTHFASHL